MDRGFVRNSIISYGAVLAMFVLNFAVSAVSARVLEPEVFGQRGLLLLVGATFVALGDLGVRQASTYLLAGNRRSANEVLTTVLVASVVLGAGHFAIGMALFALLGDSVFQGLSRWPFLLLTASMPLWLLFEYTTHVFRGLHRPVAYNALRVGNQALHLVLVLALLLAIAGTLEMAVVARVASMAATAVLSLVLLLTTTGIRWRWDFNVGAFRAIVRAGLPIAMVLSIGHLYERTVTPFMLNGFLSPVEVAHYLVAFALAETVWMLPDSVGTMLFPKIASLKNGDANRVTPQVARVTLLISAVFALGVAAVSPAMVLLGFGRDYAPAIPVLLVLLPGVVVMSVHKIVWRDLMGRARPLLSLYSRFAIFGMMGAMALTIPWLGLMGAAITVTVAFIVGGVSQAYVFQRATGVRMSELLVPGRADVRLIVDAVRRVAGRSRRGKQVDGDAVLTATPVQREGVG